MGDGDDPDDVIETSLTIDYDKQWLHCVSAIGPMLSSVQATQISVHFVCVQYASSTLHFIAVSNRFSRCLDHCFRLLRSLFESISIDYKTLELNYFVFETFYLLPFLASASRESKGPFD